MEWGLFALLGLSVLWRSGKGLEMTWLLTGAAVLLTFGRWWLEERRREATKSVPLTLWMILVLFVAWTGLSYVYSMTRNYGLDEVLRDASLALVLFWTVSKVASERGSAFTRNCVSVIAWVTLVACVIGAAVYVLQPVNRFVGSFFYFRYNTDYWPNAWAEYVLLTWPFVALWTRRFPAAARALILGFVLGCLLLSYSRGAFLVFIAQVGAWSVLLGAYRLQRRNFSFLSSRTLFLAAGMALCVFAIFFGVNHVRSRFHDVESVARKATFSASEGKSSISERREFWEESWQLSWERPLVGYGPYSFRFMQPRLQQDVFVTSDHPHNVFLKIAMERGWPAAILFLAAFLLILVPAGVRLLRTNDREWWDSLRLVSFIGVAGVLLHNLIDYNLQFVGIALPLWLAMAFLIPAREVRGNPKAAMRAVEVAVAIIIGLVAVLEGRMLVISSLGRHAEGAGKTQEALQWYARARNELFSRDLHLSRAVLSIQEGNIDAAAAALDDYEKANPEDARLWILRGDVARIEGDNRGALNAWEVAMHLGKFNYLDPLEGALRILAEEGSSEMIDDKREYYMEIFRAFGEAILRNTHFIALSHSVETFGSVGELLQRVYPSDKKELAEYTKKVVQHAEQERAKSTSRPPGLLW